MIHEITNLMHLKKFLKNIVHTWFCKSSTMAIKRFQRGQQNALANHLPFIPCRTFITANYENVHPALLYNSLWLWTTVAISVLNTRGGVFVASVRGLCLLHKEQIRRKTAKYCHSTKMHSRGTYCWISSHTWNSFSKCPARHSLAGNFRAKITT